MGNITIPAGAGILVISGYCTSATLRVGVNGLPGQWSQSSANQGSAFYIVPYGYSSPQSVQIIAMIVGSDNRIYCDVNVFQVLAY